MDEVLRRDWKWWKDDTSLEDWKKQELVVSKCEDLLAECSKHEEPRGMIKTASKFYFSDESLAPWASSKSRDIARDFIDKYEGDVLLHDTIVSELHTVLTEMKKRNLSTSTTPSGYRKTSQIKINEKLIGASYTQTLDKMSEFKEMYVASIGYLNVLIHHFNIKDNWRIILPLLLTFLDDTDLLVKREACLTLNLLCRRLSEEQSETNIIFQSQTLPLFRRALQPLILAIPSMTSESKSVVILPIAYDTVLRLYKLAIPNELEYYTTLSSMLNDSILPSLGKCKDYVRLSTALCLVLEKFLDYCGEYAIVVAKPTVYTILTILMDPYVAHAPPIVELFIDLVQRCIGQVPSQRRTKYLYDIKGCMGTLRRRMSDDLMSDFIGEKMETLIDSVNK